MPATNVPQKTDDYLGFEIFKLNGGDLYYAQGEWDCRLNLTAENMPELRKKIWNFWYSEKGEGRNV